MFLRVGSQLVEAKARNIPASGLPGPNRLSVRDGLREQVRCLSVSLAVASKRDIKRELIEEFPYLRWPTSSRRI